MPRIQTRPHERSVDVGHFTRGFKPPPRIRHAPVYFKGRLRGKEFGEWIHAVMRKAIRRRKWLLHIPVSRAMALGWECPRHNEELDVAGFAIGGKREHYECDKCWDEAIAYEYERRTWWQKRFVDPKGMVDR